MKTLMDGLDLLLHLNAHLDALAQGYGGWVYLLVFIIIFSETGLVIAPFLPGDSLLFTVGALCGTGSLDWAACISLLLLAAILGDTVNYWIGYWSGPKVFCRVKSRWFNPEHLQRTHAFIENYGGKAILFARFLPIVRTFAPFVAGVGRMTYFRFMVYNVFGGFLWVAGFISAGFCFGNLEAVKRNFSAVLLSIIFLSTLPPLVEFIRRKQPLRAKSKTATGGVFYE